VTVAEHSTGYRSLQRTDPALRSVTRPAAETAYAPVTTVAPAPEASHGSQCIGSAAALVKAAVERRPDERLKSG